MLQPNITKKSLAEVNDLVFGHHSLTFELAMSLTSVLGETVTTTVHLLYVYCTLSMCGSRVQPTGKGLIIFFALNVGKTSVPVMPGKRSKNVQGIELYAFFFQGYKLDQI